MHSEVAPKEADSHDVFVFGPDVVLAARADNASSVPAHDAMKDRLTALAEIAAGISSGTSPPPVDTNFRAADVNHIPVQGDRKASTGRFAKPVLVSLFAICGAVAAAAWPQYVDAAKGMIASFVPPFAQASSQTPAAEPSSSPADQTAQAAAPDQASATDQANAGSASAAQPAQAAVRDAAAPPGDSSQMQSMAQDIASMGQQIEQLKASIEQLRTGQDQMSRDIAKNSEARIPAPNPRSRIAAPPRSAAAPAHKPKPVSAYSPSPGYKPSPAFLATSPVYPAAPAAAPALAPAAAGPMPPPYPPQAQIAAEPDGEPVMRPPMPVR